MDQQKYVLEFDMKSIPGSMLWTFISTTNGLKQWFADDVEINNKDYLFSWDGHSQKAHLIGMRLGVYIRLHWVEEDPKSYFEMRISVNDLTNDTMLTITDFSTPAEMNDAKDLWIYQIGNLRRMVGC